MITKEMWEENLEANIRQAKPAQIEQLKQTKFTGQAMSEIRSDPRWKIYADHIKALEEEAKIRFQHEGEMALEASGNGTSHHHDYLKFKERAFTYSHVLKVLEALIERGETASEALKGVEYGET